MSATIKNLNDLDAGASRTDCEWTAALGATTEYELNKAEAVLRAAQLIAWADCFEEDDKAVSLTVGSGVLTDTKAAWMRNMRHALRSC